MTVELRLATECDDWQTRVTHGHPMPAVCHWAERRGRTGLLGGGTQDGFTPFGQCCSWRRRAGLFRMAADTPKLRS